MDPLTAASSFGTETEQTVHWEAALGEAWASFDRGDVGVGAVVVDAVGTVLGTGQNRSLVPAPDGFSGSPVAHAEIDALRRLTTGAARGTTLISTLEPCRMCEGALQWAGCRAAVYLAPDPAWHRQGEHESEPAVPWQEVWTSQAPPSRLALLAMLLPMVTFVERLPAHRVEMYRRRFPRLSDMATDSSRTGSLRALAASAPYAAALPMLADDALLAELEAAGPGGA